MRDQIHGISRAINTSKMDSSSYSLAFGMIKGSSDRLEALTDNLANSSTPGYRRVVATGRVFDNVLKDAMSPSKPIENSRRTPVTYDFTPGAIKPTGEPFDFAISGDAFFTVEKDGQEYYTRNGEFRISNDGELVTAGAGYAVQGVSGKLTVPENIDLSKVTVDSDNTVRAGERTIGELKLVEFVDNRSLLKVGGTLFSANYAEEKSGGEKAKVVNRALEGSNISVFQEMAELISNMRAFESSQKMLRTQDESEGKMIKAASDSIS